MRCSRRAGLAGGCGWAVIARVAGGAGGVRPAGARAGVPHTTARGWARRFTGRGGELGVELGGHAIAPAGQAGQYALAALTAAFGAATDLPGWLAGGLWRVGAPAGGGGGFGGHTTPPC